jgi:Mn-dependent DtxR family transcriptional regulator
VFEVLKADPDATHADLAALLGCKPSTARTYRERLRRRAAGL